MGETGEAGPQDIAVAPRAAAAFTCELPPHPLSPLQATRRSREGVCVCTHYRREGARGQHPPTRGSGRGHVRVALGRALSPSGDKNPEPRHGGRHNGGCRGRRLHIALRGGQQREAAVAGCSATPPFLFRAPPLRASLFFALAPPPPPRRPASRTPSRRPGALQGGCCPFALAPPLWGGPSLTGHGPCQGSCCWP